MSVEGRCPGCGHPAGIVLDGGHQAFCVNDDCVIIQFDTTRTYTPEELAAAETVDIPDWL